MRGFCGCWCNIAISNNVGSVKYVIGTQLPALGDERHFALADGLRFPIEGSLAIVAVRNSVRPNHLFDHNLDHDYYFELPVRGVGCPIITPVIYDAPWRCTGSPTCEPYLPHLLVIPFLAPHLGAKTMRGLDQGHRQR